MRRHYLILAEKEEIRRSLAVLLRSGGLPAALASSAPDVLQALRTSPVDTVLIATGEGDPAADKLRARILSEHPGLRVLSIARVEGSPAKSSGMRFSLGEYLLGEEELLALLAAPTGPTRGAAGGVTNDKGLRALIGLVDVLVGLLELSDRHFASSSHRAMQLARSVAEEMDLPEDLIVEIVLATLVRDIGKYGLEDVYSETGSLTDNQATRMREHVVAGTRLLEHLDFPWKIQAIIRHHHERYDGFGYPDGLKGPEIPLGARILAVVDSFVAMLSDRPHRPCLSTDEALDELERHAGQQFDPEIVEIFLRVIEARGAPMSAIERPRIVLADADAEFVGILKLRLQNEGMDVRTTPGLKETLLTLMQSPPNLILSAMEENEEDSFEMLQAIRGDETLNTVPFAFLVPSFDLRLSVRVLNQGVDECLSKSEDIDLLVARVRNILARESRRRSRSDGTRRRGITGQIENLALPDIVQMLNLGLKTACVSLTSGESSGTIWFDGGTAVHAAMGNHVGGDAFLEMLKWKTGEFTIEHGLRTDDFTIEGDTMLLLMDGLRVIDEATLADTPGAGAPVPA